MYNKVKIIILFLLSAVLAYMFLNLEKFCGIVDFSDRVVSFCSAVGIDISRLCNIYLLFMVSSAAAAYSVSQLITDDAVYRIKKGSLSLFEKCKSDITKNIYTALLSALFIYVFVTLFRTHSICARTLFFLIFLCFLVKHGDMPDIKQTISLVFLSSYGLLLIFEYFVMCFFTYEIKLISTLFLIFAVVMFFAFYKKNSTAAKYTAYFICSLTVALPLFTETAFTAKNYAQFDTRYIKIILILIFAVFAAIFAFLYKKYAAKGRKSVSTLYYLFCTVGISWLTHIRSYGTYYLSKFESSNHGISIFDALFSHEIPMLDNFDAHLFSNTLPGLLYYFINKDQLGSFSVPYAYFYSVVLCMVLFLVLKKFISADLAAVLSVVFNYDSIVVKTAGMPDNSSFMAGLVMVLFFFEHKKKKSFAAALLLWLAAALCVIIRLDAGAAFGIAAILMAFIYTAVEKDKKSLIYFVLAGLLASLVFAVPVFIHFGSVTEFTKWLGAALNTALSNQNWATPMFISPFIYYILLPAVCFLLVFISIRMASLGGEKRDILLFVMLSYITNCSRTVVRHTNFENMENATCFPYLILFLLGVWLLDCILCKYKDPAKENADIPVKIDRQYLSFVLKHRMPLFLSAGALFLFITSLGFVKNDQIQSTEVTLAVRSLNTQFENEYVFIDPDHDDDLIIKHPEKGENIQSNFRDLKQLEIFFDKMLDENQTYLDFSNNSLIYPLVKRNAPLFVNQSPGLINGEKGMIYEIERLSALGDNVPLVLMPAGDSGFSDRLDGILNRDRYYLLAEYIYRNYVPLCTIDKYELWCMPENYAEYIKYVPQNLVYKMPTGVTTNHLLGDIPYVWANYDRYPIGEYEKNAADINTSPVKEGYIMIKLDSDGNYDNQSITLNYADKNSDSYIFNVKKGQNFYKIRISTSYDRYISDMQGVSFNIAPGITYNDMFFSAEQRSVTNGKIR